MKDFEHKRSNKKFTFKINSLEVKVVIKYKFLIFILMECWKQIFYAKMVYKDLKLKWLNYPFKSERRK